MKRAWLKFFSFSVFRFFGLPALRLTVLLGVFLGLAAYALAVQYYPAVKGIFQELQIVGKDDAASTATYMPGADTAAVGTPSMKVGIGTATPTVALDVVGTVKATNFVGSGSGLTDITVSGSTSLATTSGSVGVGTSSPSNKLHISASGIEQVRIEDTSVLGSASAGLRFNTGAGANWVIGKNPNGDAATPNIFSIREQGASDRLVITTGGNVGIGTTAPVDIFSIRKDVDGEALLMFGENLAGGAASLNETAIIRFALAAGDTTTRATAARLVTGKEGDFTTVAASDGFFAVETVQNNGLIERLRITSAGNVGIGQTAPDLNLIVNDGSAANATAGSAQLGIGNWKNLDRANAIRFSAENAAAGAANVHNLYFNFRNNANTGEGTRSYIQANKAAAADTSDLRFFTGTGTGGLATEKLRIQSDGNVGIGTTAPGQKLTITGTNPTLRINDDTGAANIHMGDTGTANAAIFQMFKAGTEVVHITTDPVQTGSNTFFNAGNVGIGTTGPEVLLHVGGTSAAALLDVLKVDNADGSANTEVGIVFENGTDRTARISSANEAGDIGPLKFWTAGSIDTLTERMRITSSGNVGIGQTSPTEKLQVEGNIKVRGSGPYINWTEANVSNRGILGMVASADTNAHILVYRSGAQNFSDGTERFRVDQNGNFGIGTTGPNTPLEVYRSQQSPGVNSAQLTLSSNADDVLTQHGGISFRNNHATWGTGTRTVAQITSEVVPASGLHQIGDLRFKVKSSTNDTTLTTAMVINAAGNVGIGTTSPGAKLDIQGGGVRIANNQTISYRNVENTADFTVLKLDNSNEIIMGATTGAIDTVFIGSGAQLMRIKANGNVGIGTTTPTAKLHIGGVSGTDGIRFPDGTLQTSAVSGSGGVANAGATSIASDTDAVGGEPTTFAVSGAEKMRITSAGNVGIGTTAPGTNLDIKTTNVGGPVMADIYNVDNTNGTSSANLRIISGGASAGDPTINFLIAGVGAREWTVGVDNSAGGVFKIATGQHQYFDGNGEKFAINQTGNVGIGTTAPLEKLHVAGHILLSNPSMLRWRNAADTASVDVLQLATNSIYLGYNNDDMFFRTNSATRMAINSTGNVGIGTTTPVGQLDILGGAGAGNAVVSVTRSDGAGGGPAPSFALRQSRGTPASPTATVSGDAIGHLSFRSHDGTSFDNSAQIEAFAAGTIATGRRPSNMRFFTSPDSVAGPVERMRITESGNVGIGTTSPSRTLHVVAPTGGSITNPLGLGLSTIDNSIGSVIGIQFGFNSVLTQSAGIAVVQRDTIANSADLAFWTRTAGGSATEQVRIDRAGNVGIGTTTPTAKLHVGGTAGVDGIRFPDGTLMTSAGAGSASNLANIVDAVVNADSDLNASGAVRLQTAGADRLYITNAGNVGIGTTAPGDKLDVQTTDGAWAMRIGTANARELRLAGDNIRAFSNGVAGGTIGDLDINGGALHIQAGGNVGIGTTAPGAKLEVANASAFGEIQLKGTTGSALNFVNTDLGKNDWKIYTGAGVGDGNSFSVWDDTASSARLTVLPTSGNVGIGTTAPTDKLVITQDPVEHRVGLGGNIQYFDRARGDAFGTIINFRKSRGTIAVPTAVSAGDESARFTFSGYNDAFRELAQIRGEVDTGVGATGADMPGRITFWTSPDGSATPSERMRIDSAGNVGIGTTSPGAKLHIGDADTVGALMDVIRIGTGGATHHYTFSHFGGSLPTTDYLKLSSLAGAELMTWRQNGNVGIGTTAPGRKLQVVSATDNIVQSESTGLDSSAFFILKNDATQWSMIERGTNSDNIEFRNDTNGLTPLTIGSAGNVGIGTTAPNELLEVRGTGTGNETILRVNKTDSGTSSGFIRFYIGDGVTSVGGIRRSTTTQDPEFFTGSDRRIKNNFTPLENTLEKIAQIKLYRFDYKNSVDHGYGPVAQELEPLFPELVTRTDDGLGEELPEGVQPWTVGRNWDYFLIKAVQELKAENETLKARLNALENR